MQFKAHLVMSTIIGLDIMTAGAARAAGTAAEDTGSGIRNSDNIIVTATPVNQTTPILASLTTFEPQSIISRSIIEDSVPATSDFSDVVRLTPGASGTGNGSCTGLSESKIVLRGVQYGQTNITYDGVPVGDSNDPTHHSTAYFPNGTYERVIVNRRPSHATDLAPSSYGDNIHIISRELDDHFQAEAHTILRLDARVWLDAAGTLGIEALAGRGARFGRQDCRALPRVRPIISL